MVPRFALVGVCFLLVLAACAQPSPPTRIVLVTFDTLRWDSFDGPRASMPELAKFARDAAVFEDFYAATSSTQPTHATLFTGQHPWQHGVPRNGAVLSGEAITLAERLQAAGFHTAGVIASFPLLERFGFAQGFDVYVEDLGLGDETVWHDVPVQSGFYQLAPQVTERGLQLLDEAPAGDQFLWLHYYDPHAPYGDLAEQDRMVRLGQVEEAIREDARSAEGWIDLSRRLYDRDVEEMDASLGRLLERLHAESGEWETHVVLTSDHGESFGEGGSIGHGKRLIRSQVHVPLVVSSPRIAAGRRAETAGSVDVPTTILRLAGLPALPQSGGRDLSQASSEARNVFGMRRTFTAPYPDVRTDGSIVNVYEPRFFCARNGRLYIGDPGEVGVEGAGAGAGEGESGEELEVGELRSLFAAFLAELEGREIVEDLDPATQEALRNLGYER